MKKVFLIIGVITMISLMSCGNSSESKKTDSKEYVCPECGNEFNGHGWSSNDSGYGATSYHKTIGGCCSKACLKEYTNSTQKLEYLEWMDEW